MDSSTSGETERRIGGCGSEREPLQEDMDRVMDNMLEGLVFGRRLGTRLENTGG